MRLTILLLSALVLLAVFQFTEAKRRKKNRPTGPCQVKNCVTCKPSGKKCRVCEAGYKLRRDKRGCKSTAAPPCLVENCVKCNKKGKKCKECKDGFKGTGGRRKKYTACEPISVADPCSPNPCQNGGSCSGGSCTCLAGFLGDKCQNKDPCSPNPCQNGGSCSGGSCTCPAGYSGNNCQIRDCFRSGQQYTGQTSTTVGGRTCQRWDSNSPHIHQWPIPGHYTTATSDSEFPGSETISSAANYCRMLDNDSRPWCFTTDPGRRWEYCSPPAC